MYRFIWCTLSPVICGHLCCVEDRRLPDGRMLSVPKHEIWLEQRTTNYIMGHKVIEVWKLLLTVWDPGFSHCLPWHRQTPSKREFLTVYSQGMEGSIFPVMFSFLVPLMGSDSVNLFSEDVHPSTSLRGMSLTEISCTLQDLSNCNLTKCFAVHKVTAPMKLMLWPIGFEALWADPLVPSSPQDCICWGICHNNFWFCFLTGYLFFIFSVFWEFQSCIRIVFSKFLPCLQGLETLFLLSAFIYFTESQRQQWYWSGKHKDQVSQVSQ